MTDTLKVLGQANPIANVPEVLYTVPAGKSAVISSLVVCNQGTAANFRIWIAVGGAADNPVQYLYYDLVLDAPDTFVATIGMTLAATDVVKVQSSSAYLSYNLFGTEITP